MAPTLRIHLLPAQALAIAGLATVAGTPVAAAGKPERPPTASPDIVYLSDKNASDAVWQAGVRGVVLAPDGASGSDVSLLKSRSGRVSSQIAWSPDGSRYAWIDIGSGMTTTGGAIEAATPGGKSVVLYNSSAGDDKPLLMHGFDTLAWGPGCDGSSSTLVFESSSPFGIFALRIVNGQPDGDPVQLTNLGPNQGIGSVAFSPLGQYLAFVGYGESLAYGIAVVPMCPVPGTPFNVVPRSAIGPSGTQITSLDWSRDGARLALSMFVLPDEWRDMKVIELDYSQAGSVEQVLGFEAVVALDFTALFGAASSEHSPSWGPITSASCQRLAFSRSTDLGRSLYLLDVPTAPGATCAPATPQLLPSKYPRALDWR